MSIFRPNFKTNAVLIALLSSGMLAACGGGGSSASSSSSNSATFTVTVLDGYLSNAYVYSGITDNGSCNESLLLGVTNGFGKLSSIDEAHLEQPLCIRAVAGETVDLSRGDVADSFQLTAPAGYDVVTPVTHLVQLAIAADSSLDLTGAEQRVTEQLQQLGLNDSVLLGDYLAVVEAGGESSDAAQALEMIGELLVDNGGLPLAAQLAVGNALAEQASLVLADDGLQLDDFTPVVELSDDGTVIVDLNQVPMIDADAVPEAAQLQLGDAISPVDLTAIFTDADQDALTFSLSFSGLTQAESGLSLDNGRLFGTPTVVGDFVVMVTASDGHSTSAQVNLTYTVVAGDDNSGDNGAVGDYQQCSAPSFNTIRAAYDDGSFDDSHVPANTIDGDFSTRWSASGDKWLILDLGEAKDITDIQTYWYKANERYTTHDLEYSLDGVAWMPLASDLQLDIVDVIEWQTSWTSDGSALTDARYVRLTGHGYVKEDGSTGSWNSLLEIQVADCGATGSPTTELDFGSADGDSGGDGSDNGGSGDDGSGGDSGGDGSGNDGSGDDGTGEGSETANATISGTLSWAIDKSVGEIEGSLVVTDDDAGEDIFVEQKRVATSYGEFTIDATGDWSYEPEFSLEAVAVLSDDSVTLTDTATVTTADGSTATLTITITGIAKDVGGFDATEGGNYQDGFTDAVPAISCSQTVDSISKLEDAVEDLVAGDTLCLANGTYTGDFKLSVQGQGTPDAPITIAAANPGQAIITGGEIYARLGGKHIVLQGFVFRDGESGGSIIKFERDAECYHCRVTEVSVIDMDNGEYDSSDWVEYAGQYNRIDHNWFSGKESRGPLLVLPRWTAASSYPADYAQIDYNYFGDRPPAWGRAYAGSSDNEYEGVRLGLSNTHADPSYSVVENNYFERIQGEAEVISNKSTNNIIRNNTVRDSNGSIVTRHGANATISNNFVFGDDHPFSGGIRLVDDGHTVTNNYVEGARYASSNWNGGIVLTTGDGSGDGDNGYQNVYNVLIANNTIVDSVNSLNVYGGKNDEAAESIFFVNNIIADAVGEVIRTNGEAMPKTSIYAGNYVYGQAFSDNDDVTESDVTGFSFVDAMLEKGTDGLYRPSSSSPDLSADNNVDLGNFTLPTIDMDGQTRTSATTSGADEELTETASLAPLTSADVGPLAYRPIPGKVYIEKVDIANHDFDSGDLTGWTDMGGGYHNRCR